MRRVAITGLGAVSALGVGVAAFWDGLAAGRSGVRRITQCSTEGVNTRIAAEAAGFDPSLLDASDKLELLDRFCQLGLVAAREAWRSAGFANVDHTRTGAAIGCALAGAAAYEESYMRLFKGQRAHPYTIPRLMNNAAASHITMALGLQGPALSYATACAAGSHAIGEAGEIIRSGRADVMLAGGTDAPIVLGVIRAWEGMRVLAPEPPEGPAAACRPFSNDRQGLVIGEGAGILILEEWAHARARGAVILAELAGYGATADAGHITQPGLDAPARAMRLAMAQAGFAPSQVDYINAHGTATRLNDTTETAIIKSALGDHATRTAVSSTKSMHGHAMGASGALEAIACVLALQHQIIPPTANYREADPDCDLDYVPNAARPAPLEAVLSNSFAFGGLNAVLALKLVS